MFVEIDSEKESVNFLFTRKVVVVRYYYLRYVKQICSVNVMKGHPRVCSGSSLQGDVHICRMGLVCCVVFGRDVSLVLLVLCEVLCGTCFQLLCRKNVKECTLVPRIAARLDEQSRCGIACYVWWQGEGSIGE